MPQLFKVGSYIVYFWANENLPLEPVHVYIAEGRPTSDGSKIWITKSGHCILSHNKAHIPISILKKIMQIIDANAEDIKKAWGSLFAEISYFC